MTERRKKLLRWVGYPTLGFMTFLFALHFTFPYERLRTRAVEALSTVGDFDVAIAEIGPGWLPGRVSVKGLALTTRPKRDDEKPITFQIDQVDLSINFLPLLGKTISINVDADIGAGSVEGTVATSASGLSLDVRTNDVSLETVPGVSVVTFGAPIKGPFAARVKLTLPKNQWANASGVIEASCAGCSVGDGVTKARPTHASQMDAFSQEGVTLPRIAIGEFAARIPINKGVACMEKFEAHGGDVQLHVEGGVRFADPFKSTSTELQARIKTSDEFIKQSIRNAALFAGNKDADGWMSYQAKGPLMANRWAPVRTPMGPVRECEGIAPPPTPPKSSVARTGPPANPEPPRHAIDAETDPKPAGVPPVTTLPPPEATPPPAPEPTPPPPPAPEPAPVPAAAEPAAQPVEGAVPMPEQPAPPAPEQPTQ